MIKEGSIVKAKAGRDKDLFFVVVKLEGGYAYIANGKRRKVEAPKKKKLIHLQATNSVAAVYETNRQIKTIINEFGGYNV
ncbi:MAG: KOW domain-containing RNA-binding protein [Ruminococcus sp.]|nr:KOW domain-containing RNA-binding protein [Ruminococcus sp.]